MATPVSNIGIIDVGLRSALYNRFVSYLSPAGQTLPLSQIVIDFPKEVAQREYAEKQGSISTDFISMFRNVTEFTWERQRTAPARAGINLNYSDGTNTTVVNAKVIPLDLTYEVVFWHHSRDVINQLIEKYFFWIQSSPTLELTLQGYPVSTYLQISGVRDISTVRNMYQVGKYWIYEGSIKVAAWVPELDLSGSVIQEIICSVYYKQNGMTSNLLIDTITIP